MWTPTHVQVTVHKARNLIPKGKAGTNDAYVTIALGKEKYQTSVKERSENPEWSEECDLPIPGLEGSVLLNVYHRNLLGLDEFLGHVSIPLDQFQIYERPKPRWYALKNKPSAKKAEKYRGEIEVKFSFIVQSLSRSEVGLDKIKRTSSIRGIASHVGEKLKHNLHGRGSFKGSKGNVAVDDSDLHTSHDAVQSSKSSPIGIENRRMSMNPEFLLSSKNSPIGISENRRMSMNPELLSSSYTMRHSPRDADDNSSTGTVESGHSFTKSPPPKPPRSSKKKREQMFEQLSHSTLPSLQHDSSSPPKGEYVFKQTGAQSMYDLSVDTSLQETSDKLSHSDKDLNTSDSNKEDDGPFSRTNSFRQAIPRGSFKKKSGETRPKVVGRAFTPHSPGSSPKTTRVAEIKHENQAIHTSHHSLDSVREESPVKETSPPKSVIPSDFQIPDSSEKPTSSLQKSESLDRKTEKKIVIEKRNSLPRESTSGSSQFDSTNPFDCDSGNNSFTSSEERMIFYDDTEGPSVEKTIVERPRTLDTSPALTKKKKKAPSPPLQVDTGRPSPKDSPVFSEHRRTSSQDSHKTTSSTHSSQLEDTIQEYKKARDSTHEENKQTIPPEVMEQFEALSREDLVRMICKQRVEIDRKNNYQKDLEGYIDNLLVKVIETQPVILQNPYRNSGGMSLPPTPSPPITPPHMSINYPVHPLSSPSAAFRNFPPSYQQNTYQTPVKNNQNVNYSSPKSSVVINTNGQSNNKSTKKDKKLNNPFKKISVSLKS